MTTIEQTIKSVLVSRGWTAQDYTAIASKQYETAVGPKQALVYLQDFGPQEEQLLLVGDYQSEGRNCLSSHGVLVPKCASVAKVKELADWFSIQADKAVGQTYAMKLMRHQH